MSGTVRILVVDDIEAFRIVLDLALTAPGREVVSVPSISDAMQRYLEEPFDLIVSDYSMPGGTGMDLLRRVREIDRHQPFVLMSADLPRGVARDAQLHGALVLEKYDAMTRLPAAFAPGEGDPVQALFESRPAARRPAVALTQNFG